MRGKRTFQVGLASAVLAGGSLFGLPGFAWGSLRPHSFASEQKQLERQLADRAAQLGRLGTDVSGAKKLTSAHALALDARSADADQLLNALIAKVPTDTTQAQLNSDKASVLQVNQAFAVLTPQVFETIEADAITAEATTLQADEPTLQSLASSLVGQGGYKNALDHDVALVKSVNQAIKDSRDVATVILAQTRSEFPGDTQVFLHTNKDLLNSGTALANASYDESIIGLALGGYTGP